VRRDDDAVSMQGASGAVVNRYVFTVKLPASYNRVCLAWMYEADEPTEDTAKASEHLVGMPGFAKTRTGAIRDMNRKNKEAIA
jgi:hypothetical protein